MLGTVSTLQCATSVVLARPGEAKYESSTWTDEGGSLTRLGREQSGALADHLAGRRIAHVWTSTLARAVQTGEIIAATLGVDVSTRSGLREFDVGDFLSVPRAQDPFASTYALWLGGDDTARVPGGESGSEVIARMHETLTEISDIHRGETVLVISHGGALRLAVSALTRMTGIEPARLTHCGTVEIEMDSDDWVCRAWS